jgi:hypothetical protein
MPLSGSERSTLVNELTSAANSSGGWSYYPGKASRLEPTAWALLALGANGGTQAGEPLAHRDFLAHCQRNDGWLSEDAGWPVNIGFNALAAFAWVVRPELAPTDKRLRLLTALMASKGVQVPSSPSFVQDNSLQGWSWIAETFSWVEPTAWGAFALKKAVRAGLIPDTAARARIQEADRLLVDRCCRHGGWNFGNANVMGQDLFPHVPTTAIALIALQDHRDESAVTRSISFLESHWGDEPSTMALGLSLICLSVYGRPVNAIEERLRAHVADQQRPHAAAPRNGAAPLISVHGRAVALCALSLRDNGDAFRI